MIRSTMKSKSMTRLSASCHSLLLFIVLLIIFPIILLLIIFLFFLQHTDPQSSSACYSSTVNRSPRVSLTTERNLADIWNER